MTEKYLWQVEARSEDGSGNNPYDPTLGQAGTQLSRAFLGIPDGTPAIYGDPNTTADDTTGNPREYPDPVGPGLSQPDGQIDLIRDIVRTTANLPNSYGTTELGGFYGQFITHDMSASAVPVPVPFLEQLFPNASTDPNASDFLLSLINRTPFIIDSNGIRQQVDAVTHWLDLSDIYGSGEKLATDNTFTSFTTLNEALRVNSYDPVQHAMLLTGADGGMPTFQELLANNGIDFNNPANAGLIFGNWGPTTGDFAGDPNQLVGGDARDAQTPMLASIVTVWTLEHNYQVNQLASQYSYQISSGEISSDELYNMARNITVGEYQHTVYDEYLGSIIGKDNVPQYTGYDPYVDGTVRNLFTSVAFRFGHDQLSDFVPLVDANGNVIDSLNLAQSFLETSQVLQQNGGLEDMLRGLLDQKSQEIDGQIVPSLIDNALNIPGLNLNLGLLDNVRAADEGIGTLNEVRVQLGLDPYTSFDQLVPNEPNHATIVSLLQQYYGSIDNVDPFIGGLIEAHVAGSQLGETFQKIVIEQFTASMEGDMLFYENQLKDFPELIADIQGTTLADIIARDTGVDHPYLDAFHVAFETDGTYKADTIYGADNADFLKADLIIGGDGNDKLYGKDGNDTLYGDMGNDKLDGGNGDDYLKGGYGNDTELGGNGDDMAWGDGGNDTIKMGAGNDWADGGDGNDTMYGDDGDDTLLGKGGNDKIYGGNGNDKVFGGDGNDTVSGDNGDDYVYGGAGDDKVYGGAGNDHIDGGYGNDQMWGGAGWDTFVFGYNSGYDKIKDFNVYQGTRSTCPSSNSSPASTTSRKR